MVYMCHPSTTLYPIRHLLVILIFSQILSCKRYDLEGFAFYAQQVRIMREERERERDNLNRSSTLLKSLLASGVAVSREVRGLMEHMETEWRQCERGIRDMEEFVHKQTPVKAMGLQENMEVSLKITCMSLFAIILRTTVYE